MFDANFVEILYNNNYINISADLTYPIKQYGSLSFINRLENIKKDDLVNPNGSITFQWGIKKGILDFSDLEYITFVNGSLIVKLKDGKENYLLIQNFPYEEYEKSRDLFRSWGIEVRN